MENKNINLDSLIEKYTSICLDNCKIDPELNIKHKVFRGLRDLDGRGVLTGLTEISDVISRKTVDGKEIFCPGELYYRGYNIKSIIDGFTSQNRFGFEEVTYLLLFGSLPNKEQLTEFKNNLGAMRTLPDNFVRDVIMKAPSSDLMNSLARSVLTLYSYDRKADDTSISNLIKQSLQLIARFPALAVYSYNAHNYHWKKSDSFFIHEPKSELSTAENILYLLRIDGNYTELEAKVLDMALVLHAEHGGGNNSTFTTHVVSSSGTDTYSAIAAALGSLKGPKHGGANLKVAAMFEDIKSNVKDWKDDEEVSNYIDKIVNKQAFDKTGLVYGIGHAIYSVSDPRAQIFKGYVEKLSSAKGRNDEFSLYSKVEELAPKLISKQRKMYKGVSANVDFYSGFVYDMLGLPRELFTPIFAIARIAGWSAHRIEEILNAGKIIRPAYMAVEPHKDYIPLENRK